ncbi:hypothetical protein MPG64_02290 [Helicobacter pylori]|uniref:hypothetical protein n=1 Tax=Helicobacter pylori TaxID=210 RepID=UPI001FD22DEF|nr:hypothetical protein [Helicobacter pylori]UOR65359.1 hypothetical protein MPG64_02290 [Helicobacter pylori]
MDADNKVDNKKLDFNGAIKTLRKIETKPTLFNHYRNGNSVSNLNRNNPTTNEFKTQEPQRTKQQKRKNKHANTCA